MLLEKTYNACPYVFSEPDPNQKQPIERAVDGLVWSTHLPDGTVIDSFRENFNRSLRSVHVVRRADYSAVFIDATNCKIASVTSNARNVMNEKGSKSSMGKDLDYMIELHYSAQESPCVYYANLKDSTEQSDPSTLFLKDPSKGHTFQVDVDMILQKLQTGEGSQQVD